MLSGWNRRTHNLPCSHSMPTFTLCSETSCIKSEFSVLQYSFVPMCPLKQTHASSDKMSIWDQFAIINWVKTPLIEITMSFACRQWTFLVLNSCIANNFAVVSFDIPVSCARCLTNLRDKYLRWASISSNSFFRDYKCISKVQINYH